MTGVLALPEGCIAAVISFTTPRDACRLACVSTTFRSAADSDVVWDRFLPPEYLSAISDPGSVSGSSSSSTTWSALSKKQLYFRACHNPIHKGKMSFWFDLPSGKNCYMISPRELIIEDSDNIYAWGWVSIADIDADRNRYQIPDIRFPEVAVHQDSTPFEIGCKINTSLLSPMTTYVAYLVFAENRVCFHNDEPAEVDVGLAGSDNGLKRTVFIHREQQGGDIDGFYPKKRADRWLETELGEFFNGDDDDEGELLITIKSEMKECLLIQGIEIRPNKE